MYIEREVGGRGMNYLIDFGASLFFLMKSNYPQ